MYRNCPYNTNKKMTPISMVQKYSTTNGISWNIPRINASLEDRKEHHQSTMLEVEGKISNTIVSILIDSGFSLSYIAPRVLKNVNLVKKNKKMHGWYSWQQR